MFPSTSDATALTGLVDELRDVDAGAGADADADDLTMVKQLETLERIKASAAAAQVRITATFDDGRAGHSDASIGAEVGLARHESPHRGRGLLRLARALVDDLPETLAALERGDINEHRAQIIAEETRDLTREDRRTVDRDLAPVAARLGNRELRLAAQRIVMKIDEAGAVRRRERAQTRRRVTGRRLPDGMAQINATISDIHYAAIMTSLHERAATEIATGVADDRSRGQLIADIFVERLTGQTMAAAVPVNLDLVIAAETLFGDGDEPADIPGQGPIPASVARNLAHASPEQRTKIRRLFRFDDTDRLIAMEATTRGFTGLLAAFVKIRDQVCRTPWCNAPIKHIDHPEAVARGGATTELNSQGLCEACNYVKEGSGWRHRVISDPLEQHTIEITTPSGTQHHSRAPAPPRGATWRETRPGVWTLAA